MNGHGGIVIALCLSGTCFASEPSVFGTWCSSEGDGMEIDATGLGNFEHTVCDWGKPQKETKTIDTEIHCRSVHMDGSKIIETQKATYHFKARLLPADQLEVDYSDGRPPSMLQRCSL